MAENKGFSLKTFGMPWWLAGAIAVIVIAAAATGALSADLAGCFALMLSIGLICNEVGERIPFWNSYIGGGLVMTFLVSAFLFTYNLIPQKYADGMIMIMDDADFLSFFLYHLPDHRFHPGPGQKASDPFLRRVHSGYLRRSVRRSNLRNRSRSCIWYKPG